MDEGLRVVEHALERAPGMPRALAIEGALYLERAKIDPGQEKAARERARADLTQAIAGTPLLRRRHGEAAAEAARQLEGP